MVGRSIIVDGVPAGCSNIVDGDPVGRSNFLDVVFVDRSNMVDGEPVGRSNIVDGEPVGRSNIVDGPSLGRSLVGPLTMGRPNIGRFMVGCSVVADAPVECSGLDAFVVDNVISFVVDIVAPFVVGSDGILNILDESGIFLCKRESDKSKMLNFLKSLKSVFGQEEKISHEGTLRFDR